MLFSFRESSGCCKAAHSGLLLVTPSSGLKKVLRRAYEAAAEAAAPKVSIHSLLPDEGGPSDTRKAPNEAASADSESLNSKETLRVSLSRPLMPLTNQRDELRRAVARVAEQASP